MIATSGRACPGWLIVGATSVAIAVACDVPLVVPVGDDGEADVGQTNLETSGDAAAPPGSDFYFDATNGDDDAGGSTPQTAWKSFRKVFALALAPGDCVHLKRGEVFYYSSSTTGMNNKHGTAENPIRMQAYGDPALPLPSIRGVDLLDSGWAATAVTEGGITVYEHAWTRLSANQPITESAQIWIDRVPTTVLPWNGSVQTTFKDVPTQAESHAVDTEDERIYIARAVNPNLDDAVIEGLGNGHTGNYVLRFFDADYWVISDIDWFGGHNACILLGGNTAPRVNKSVTFERCTFGDTLGQVIEVNVARDTIQFELTVRGCTFGEMLERGRNAIRVQGAGDGINNGHTVLIEDNIFDGVDHGIQIGKQNAAGESYANGVIRYNVFKNTKDDAIWSPGAKLPDTSGDKLDVYYNVVMNAGDQGIQFTGGAADEIKSVRIWNNTIVGCNQDGMLLYGCDSTCEAKNNLLSNNNRQHRASQRIHDRDYAIEAASSGGDVDYNLVFNNGATTFSLATTDNATTVTEHESWADYLAASGQDEHSIHDDPRLGVEKPAALDEVRLRPDSPAIDAGITVGLTRDFAGTPIPQGSAPDIGAFETITPTAQAVSPKGVLLLAAAVVVLGLVPYRRSFTAPQVDAIQHQSDRTR